MLEWGIMSGTIRRTTKRPKRTEISIQPSQSLRMRLCGATMKTTLFQKSPPFAPLYRNRPESDPNQLCQQPIPELGFSFRNRFPAERQLNAHVFFLVGHPLSDRLRGKCGANARVHKPLIYVFGNIWPRPRGENQGGSDCASVCVFVVWRAVWSGLECLMVGRICVVWQRIRLNKY